MTPEPRTTANRRNAAKSTGPKSPAGKRRASANALRHGLTSQASANTDLIQSIAKALAGDLSQAAPALEVAQLEDLILRIRQAKAQAYDDALTRITSQASALTPPEEIDSLALIAAAPDLLKFDEYERKAMSRRRRALAALDA
ncbi:MAG: hypothetical protein WA047_19690 [Phenylobacterium sp.]|uniref:hypothetical protein n=1 Tax=Phenylobacterium sp. TaxID=1871053 RepID=UPI003BB7D2DC